MNTQPTQITFPKSLVHRKAILYVLGSYFGTPDFSITDSHEQFIISLPHLEPEDRKKIEQEIAFHSLRFDIADQNQDIRKDIIAQALGSVNTSTQKT
jgi:hypothetical protein